MKKEQILKLIDANKTIKKNAPLLSITKEERFNTTKSKEYWFPNIEDLKEEFNVLSEEVQSALDETTNCEKCFSDCSHDVRLEHYHLFGKYSKCVFCEKTIESNNNISWELSTNRNRYCVNLSAKHQDDDDHGDIPDGYTNEDVFEIIMNIIKDKKDDEDIDLIQEFKKLKLNHCNINEEKKVNENFILIIGGSNKHYIDYESYLYKKGLNIQLDFIQYFSGLLNTKVKLIDNNDVFDNKNKEKYFPKDNYNLKFVNYETIDDLEKILSSNKDIPFKLIIDLSEIYLYETKNNSISKKIYNLNLQEYFKESKIIRINNLSSKTLDELTLILKENNDLYAYQNDKYYYIDNDDIKSDDLENTCNKLKRLLKNKEV